MDPESAAARLLPLFLIVIGHLGADFLCQDRTLSRRKRSSGRWIVFHALAAGVFALVMLVPYAGVSALLAALTLAAGHGVIDLLKIRREKNAGGSREFFPGLCLLDQAAHLVVMALAWRLFLFDSGWPFRRPPDELFWGYLALVALLCAAARLLFSPPFPGIEEEVER